MPPQVWRQVSGTWATRGWLGVLEPPARSRVTPMSCAPRIPDTSYVAPVLPVARTPALRAVPSLITHSWYAWSAPGDGSLPSTATASFSERDETTVTCPPPVAVALCMRASGAASTAAICLFAAETPVLSTTTESFAISYPATPAPPSATTVAAAVTNRCQRTAGWRNLWRDTDRRVCGVAAERASTA